MSSHRRRTLTAGVNRSRMSWFNVVFSHKWVSNFVLVGNINMLHYLCFASLNRQTVTHTPLCIAFLLLSPALLLFIKMPLSAVTDEVITTLKPRSAPRLSSYPSEPSRACQIFMSWASVHSPLNIGRHKHTSHPDVWNWPRAQAHGAGVYRQPILQTQSSNSPAVDCLLYAQPDLKTLSWEIKASFKCTFISLRCPFDLKSVFYKSFPSLSVSQGSFYMHEGKKRSARTFISGLSFC